MDLDLRIRCGNCNFMNGVEISLPDHTTMKQVVVLTMVCYCCGERQVSEEAAGWFVLNYLYNERH